MGVPVKEQPASQWPFKDPCFFDTEDPLLLWLWVSSLWRLSSKESDVAYDVSYILRTPP